MSEMLFWGQIDILTILYFDTVYTWLTIVVPDEIIWQHQAIWMRWLLGI